MVIHLFTDQIVSNSSCNLILTSTYGKGIGLLTVGLGINITRLGDIERKDQGHCSLVYIHTYIGRQKFVVP